MATKAQYDAASTAILKILQDDIAQDVPAMFRSELPQSEISAFATAAAKAALAAAEGVAP
jgi:hypothetical protein